MGCAQPLPNTIPASSDSRLTIWGDFFNQETRALLAMCEMAEVQVAFTLVDTFQKQNENRDYTEVNPTMSIPMITDGPWKILGEGISVYTYLMNSYPKIKAMFYSEDQESQINDVFRHFMTTVRKTTTQLIRCIANKKVFNMPKQPID